MSKQILEEAIAQLAGMIHENFGLLPDGEYRDGWGAVLDRINDSYTHFLVQCMMEPSMLDRTEEFIEFIHEQARNFANVIRDCDCGVDHSPEFQMGVRHAVETYIRLWENRDEAALMRELTVSETL